jgi:predicted amidohydrolase YtcJ
MTVTIYRHPNFLALDQPNPKASAGDAMLVVNGLVEYLGDTGRARELAKQRDEPFREVALSGAAIIPGFHDAHIHFGSLAVERDTPDARAATSLAETLEIFRAYAADHPGDGWVVGGRWNRNRWSKSDPEPHRLMLDEIFPDRPVAMASIDGHAQWFNSAALRIGGFHANSPDIPGGVIVRDSSGEPTGLMFEKAFDDLVAVAEASMDEQLPKILTEAQEELLKTGVTHITDLDSEAVRTALMRMRDEGTLHVRVHKGIPMWNLSDAIAEGRRTGEGDDWITVGPVKLFADGALGPHTAAMHEAYEDEPDNTGVAVITSEALAEWVRLANDHGIAIATHAIGDRANTAVIDAYEKHVHLTRERGLTNRIEHAQHISPGDISRIADLGIAASMQPTHCTGDYPLSVELLGQRATKHYPWRSLLDAGATVIFGSDGPIEPHSGMVGVHAAVTRSTRDNQPAGGREPEEKISVLEALHAYTREPARVAGLERAGRITPGSYADFVVLDADPFTVEEHDLWKVQVLTTVVNGEIVYSRSPVNADRGSLSV